MSKQCTVGYAAKALTVTRFVTLLSTIVVNSLEKFLWLQRVCHGMEPFVLPVRATLVAVYT